MKEYIQNIELKRIYTDGSHGPSVVVNGKTIPYITFSVFDRFKGQMQAIFTTRLGGVSTGDCASLNLSFTRGDQPDAVLENFKLVGQELGIELTQFVCSMQTHTTNIRQITQKDAGKGVVKDLDYENIDGLITNEPGLCLSLFYADCVPVYFYDPVNRAIGVAHSGWKGTVGQISAKMLMHMKLAFGTNPKEVYVAIGPSICQGCYEVSEDVALEFQKVYRTDSILAKGKAEKKYQLNLWEAISQTLLLSGVLEDHIQRPDICTCCNPEIFFSHRASGGKRGNLGAFMMLNGD
ncbi:MAG: peptidoglycan editing factor PgeF [Lachnospiraceae bacterium]|nr:peptidoglycan editing factor PgeF [Lachnospiraceae bacterium]